MRGEGEGDGRGGWERRGWERGGGGGGKKDQTRVVVVQSYSSAPYRKQTYAAEKVRMDEGTVTAH